MPPKKERDKEKEGLVCCCSIDIFIFYTGCRVRKVTNHLPEGKERKKRREDRFLLSVFRFVLNERGESGKEKESTSFSRASTTVPRCLYRPGAGRRRKKRKGVFPKHQHRLPSRSSSKVGPGASNRRKKEKREKKKSQS